MKSIRLSELTVYPIKSCGGSSVGSCLITAAGAQHDRTWRVVFGKGDSLSQTHCSKMALVRTEIVDGSVSLSFLGQDRVSLPLQSSPGGITMRLSETCDGIDEGDEVAQWLSSKFGIACHLMRVASKRPFAGVAPEQRDSELLFIGQPLLIISQDSLDDLNRRLPDDVRMNRFRPNLVVSGCEAYAENCWQRIRVGSMEFTQVEPCGRCAVVLVDQEKGERTGKEPLRTLASYRRQGKAVVFGHYFAPVRPGILRLGDTVTVLS